MATDIKYLKHALKPSLSLREHKFFDTEKAAATAFVAATDREWAQFEKNGCTDLESFGKNIVLQVKGHHPTQEEQTRARRMFSELYPSAIVGRQV